MVQEQSNAPRAGSSQTSSALHPTTALVTGATGFIGSAVCRALLEQGHQVRALHRPTSSLEPLEGLHLERLEGDILLPHSLHAPMQDVQVVFHTAAQAAYWRFPEQVIRAAIEGTYNVAHAASEVGVRRLIITSSIAAMGIPPQGELLDETCTFSLPMTHFPYGYAKYQAELQALDSASEGLEVVIVNPTVVIGPGDRHRISGSLIIEAARGRTFLWIEGGLNLVHLEDVVAGHLAAAAHGRPGERYILGGENLSYRQIFNTLSDIVQRRPPWLKLPHSLIEPAARAVEVLGRVVPLPLDGNQLRMSRHYLYCDISKAARELGLSKPLPFRQAAEDAFHWYRTHGFV